MNSGPNSDLNSALSPKIGQVHSVQTQLTLVARMVRPGCAQCAQAARAGVVSWSGLDRVAALQLAVSQA